MRIAAKHVSYTMYVHKRLARGGLSTRLNMSLCRLARARSSSSSWWSQVPVGPPDAIFGLVEAFNKDSNPNKVNLAIGAYRDGEGKPYVLPVVRKAEKLLYERNLDKEYAGIMGYESFRKAALELALGKEDEKIKNKLNVTMQTVSGTNALCVGLSFLANYYPHEKTIYFPNPTWTLHVHSARAAGLDMKYYRYYDPSTRGFDAAGAYEDLSNLPEKSIVLLQACAHNPTGVDMKTKEWAEVSKICKERDHFVFVDMAYQGFATGDLDRDAAGLRQMVKDGHRVLICQSFSKSMGLYGERIGATSILCENEEEVKAVESQLKILVRPLYSNPPINGARIATEIMTNPELYQKWLGEMKLMSARGMEMRERLKKGLIKEGSTKNWSHITEQIGMFCYSGLTQEQVDLLRTDFSIYMTRDGRVSMVSLTPKNMDYVAKAIHKVTK